MVSVAGKAITNSTANSSRPEGARIQEWNAAHFHVGTEYVDFGSSIAHNRISSGYFAFPLGNSLDYSSELRSFATAIAS